MMRFQSQFRSLWPVHLVSAAAAVVLSFSCGGQHVWSADGINPTSKRPVLEVTASTTLDPQKTYGAIVIKASNVVIDGKGAWLKRDGEVLSKNFKGTAILAEGVSNVTLRNLNANGWETGLKLIDCQSFTIENCDFSNNFHDPDFGWGENGRRGGIVLERVTQSTLRNNKANNVWDGCVLVESDDNLIEDNDFSKTSNTCLKLWTASRNVIKNNKLTHGIRISPGEVHARDSTSVLIESGSNDNQFVGNDCTHGGDGIFVRVLNGWCSVRNRFEENDCSYANNNGFECWAPHNVFIGNKANHCSYGFWLGGSDDTRLIENEASFNGLLTEHHNSPHLADNGHAGIVFMFGPSSHTLARGNTCRGNNGAGIALIGDLESRGRKWRAFHWILEDNQLTENRWGIYAKHADWITLTENRFFSNQIKDLMLNGDVKRVVERQVAQTQSPAPPVAKLDGPTIVHVGVLATWSAAASRSAEDSTDATSSLKFDWHVGEGELRHGPEVTHIFGQAGFQRIGVNVSNESRTDLAWRDVYVVREGEEIGTEGQAANWTIEDFHERVKSNEQISRATFVDSEALVGKSGLKIVIKPYAGFRVALSYPKNHDGNWSLSGKSKLVFWLKAINEDVTGWQGGPFISLRGDGEQLRRIEPKPGLDPMRQLDHNEAREGWRLMQIPLNGDQQWLAEGEPFETVRSLSIGFDSWGAPPLRIWIDGLRLE